MKKKVSLELVNRKLDKILSAQAKLFKEEKRVEHQELALARQEQAEIAQLAHLENVSKDIERELGSHPLSKVTSKDIAKGFVGAFVGIVAHFTFFYGIEVAEWISIERAIALYPISFAIGGIFMYATGFRKVKDSKVLHFLPIRLIVLYSVSLIVAATVLFFFSPEFTHSLDTAIKQLSTVTLIAIIGACTADLIGKE